MISKNSIQERYQLKPFIGSSHNWAFKQLSHIPKNSKVLDIGSGAGVMGRFLRAQGLEQLYAVEPDAEARLQSQSVYAQMAESLLTFRNERFDQVLLLDVLEHIADPHSFLKEVAALLVPNGTLLISVPNVAHWSVRFSLLFGFFEYSRRGILDRTHLHFFTRRTFKKLLQQTEGLSCTALDSSIEPAEFVLPKFIWDNALYRTCSLLRLQAARLLPGLLSYQHLAVIKKVAV